MSDEMRWGQGDRDTSENVSESTERSYRYDGEVPNAGSTGNNAANTGSFGNIYNSQNTSRQQTSQAPRYAHYQVRQNEEKPHTEQNPDAEQDFDKDQGSDKLQGKNQEKAPKRKDHGKKGFGSTVAAAVVFGLVAGIVFQGVNAVAGRFTQKQQTPLAMTETLPDTDDGLTDVSDMSRIVAQNGTVAGVAQAAMPCVVAITSVSIQEIPNYFYSFFGYGGGTKQYQSAGSGSGIIVGENDDELLIATNNHVVEGATTLSVCFIGNDVVSAEQETQYIAGGNDINVKDAVSAKIKGTDAENDLAVVAVKKKDIPQETMDQIKIAQLGSSDELMVGEQVVAIGNALGYGQSVTSGWISALDRSVVTEEGTSSELIQTDAAINPGNSGGALLNMRGELIGINAAKYASSTVEGMGYAIPISKAQPILESLMNRKTRDKVDDQSKAAYLGVQLANLSTEAIQMYNMPAGAFVYEVTKGEAADTYGIQKNDIIMKLDGQKVSGREDLIDKLQYYTAGEEVEMEIARPDNGDYKEQTITITLGKRPE